MKKYFIFKLTKSIISSLFTLITLPLITRSLGPVEFGNFNYIKQFFDRIFEFLDIGTNATAPYVTKNVNQYNIYVFLIFYYLILSLTSFLLISIILNFFNFETFFHVKSKGIVLLIISLSLLTIFYNKFIIIFDAIGHTVKSELIQIISKFLITICIILFFVLQKLNIKTLATIQLCLTAITIILFFNFLVKKIVPLNKTISISEIYKHFINYSFPIWGSTLLLVISSLLERWMLQYFSGAEQQGFFSLGIYVGAIPLLITGAFTPLLLRQYTIQSNSKYKLRYLFQKYSTFFFVIATIPSCFFALNSEYFVNLLGGKSFYSANFVVSILCLAPIHQTYGQLTGSLMMATGKTKDYSKINILSMLIGIVLAMVLLAPQKYLGLNLGANGLAIKLFIMQIISVNLQVLYVTKFLRIKFYPILIHQLYVISFFVLFTFILKNVLIYIGLSGILMITINTLLYILGISLLGIYKTEFLGINKKFLFQILRGLKDKLKFKIQIK